MAAKYYNISQEEMHKFLTGLGFIQIQVDRTRELVYAKRVDQDNLKLSLRIYTGINPNGRSRDVGKDAIRVNLFMRTPNGKIIKLGGSKRVHRVENWKANLKKRIKGWTDYLPEHACPKCGNPLIVRENKTNKNKFLGCSTYPDCEHTEKAL